MKEIITVYLTGVLAILFGTIFAGCSCRKRLNIWRFMLWQFIWSVTVAMVCLSVYTVIIIVHDTMLRDRFPDILASNLAFGLRFGVALYVILLPYMVLAFGTELYWKRFCRCFQIRQM